MKFIVREEVVRSILVEADDETSAIEKAYERYPLDWDSATKACEVTPAGE